MALWRAYGCQAIASPPHSADDRRPGAHAGPGAAKQRWRRAGGEIRAQWTKFAIADQPVLIGYGLWIAHAIVEQSAEVMIVTEPVSLQHIVRQRQQAGFVGRDGQLALFRENLRLPVLDARKRFLFNIHGDGGVGKTFLVRQLRRVAREEGAADAYTDEYAYGVPEAMAALAEQLGKPLREFRDRYAAFDQRRDQMARDPQAPLAAWSQVTRAAVKIGLHASKALPGAAPVVDLIDADAAAEAADQVRVYLSRKFSDSKDVRLLLNPVEELTPEFVRGLRELAGQRTVALFFDTYERTAPVLDGWLLDVLAGRFGDLPAAVVLTVAGREPLGASGWTDYLDLIAPVPLLPFTETETRQLLATKGVTAEPVVQTVWTLSGGLPLLVAMLAESRPKDSAAVDDPSGTAVERFLKWEHDAQRRQAVLLGALSRQMDADVLAVLAPQMDARATLGWLCGLPFIASRAGRFEYHEVVRTPMLRMQRAQSAQGWRDAHDRLANAHQQWREQVRSNPDWSDSEWLHHRLEETYHRLCAEPSGAITMALHLAVAAVVAGAATARQWAETIRMAGRDAGNDQVHRWGKRLLACVGEQRADCTNVLSELLQSASLPPALRVDALIERGRLHYYADRDEQAIADLSQAIQIDPHRSVAYAWRGRAHAWLGRYQLALCDLDRAIDLDPEFDWVFADRGETYRSMGRHEEALADLNQAIKLDPGYARAYGVRGETYHAMGRDEEALTDFTQAINLDPGYVWAFAGRGETYRVTRRHEEALADLNQAIKLNPGYAWAIGSRGETYLAMGRHEEAITDLNQAIKLNPKLDWAIGSRGETYLAMGRHEEALTDLNQAIKLNPRSARAYGVRGQAYQTIGRYEEALTDLDQAINLNPRPAWALGSRGETYRLMGRHEEALNDFTQAIELDPDDAWYYGHRGFTRRDAGSIEEAEADFARARDIDSSGNWAGPIHE